MGWPVVTVTSGGLPVTDNSTLGWGTPVEEAANGLGTPVTYVTSGGIATLGGTSGGSVTVGEQQAYLKGSYSAFAFTFAAVGSGLVKGTDFDAHWTLKPSTFPNQSVLNWFTPKGTIPNGLGVWGYHHIDFGNYDANNQLVPVTPCQICNLTTLSNTFDFSYTGTSVFNLLHEAWLTNAAHPQPAANSSPNDLFEIGFLLHASDLTFHNSGSLIGTSHVNNGVTYTARLHSGPYVTFAPAADVLTGTVDWRAAFLFLVANEVLTGSEWWNGHAFGIEMPAEAGTGTRTGQLTVNSYAVTEVNSGASPATDYLGANVLTNGNSATSGWSGTTGVTAVTTGQTDLDSGTTAAFMNEDATTGTHELFNAGFTVPTAQHDYIYFVDVENTKSRDAISILIAQQTTFASSFQSRFLLSSQTFADDALTAGSGLTVLSRQVIALGNNWYRAVVRFTKAAGITGLFLSNQIHNGTTNSYAGDITKGIIFRPRFRLVQTDGLAITNSPPAASQSIAYTYTPTVVGGTAAYTYALVGTLPAGLTFTSSTGVISGTPTTLGTSTGLSLTVTDANGLNASIGPFSIAVTAAVAPVNTVAPALTNPSVQAAWVGQGQTLSVSNGTWTGTPSPTFTYQWTRAGTNISGATSSTYAVQAADDAAAIGCTVTATNIAGNASASSGTVTAVAGTVILNENFTAGQGSWSTIGGVSYSGGKATLTALGAFSSVPRPIAGLTAGKVAFFVYDLTFTGGNLIPRVTGATNPGGTLRSTSGTFTDSVTIPATPTGIDFQSQATTNATIDNVFVVQKP